MTTVFLIRHAESVANARNLLAGRQDYALTDTGKRDAAALATEFAATNRIDRIWCSPLLRAQQTAAPFLLACDAPLCLDERLLEQHLGRFSGLSYADVENDPGYCTDRSARWDWVPDGGGESYRMIAARVGSFLADLRERCARDKLQRVLLVTHAVTLRLFRACLEGTLPRYPREIAANGEVWGAQLVADGVPTRIETLVFAHGSRQHRA
ncbi:MAG: histidine phosphatase family protein [Propionivibrio sp.]